MAEIFDTNGDLAGTVEGAAGETNILHGLGGGDTIIGKELADTIRGGLGSDVMTSGLGADIVYFQHNYQLPLELWGADLWSDFSIAEGDKVNVANLGQGSFEGGGVGIGEFATIQAIASMSGATTARLLWGTSSLRLNGLTSTAQLTAAQFVFNTVNASDYFFDLGSGNDIIATSLGDDIINAGSGNDTVFGEQGADTLAGGDGNDWLWGGSGIDLLDGGKHNDNFIGGTGADKVKFRFVQYVDNTTYSTGTDTWRDFKVAEGDRVDVSGFSEFVGVTKNSDSIGEFATIQALVSTNSLGDARITWGTSILDLMNVATVTASMFQFDTATTADTFNLGAGNDVLAAAAGNDTLNGNNGHDKLFGEQGNDTLNGAAGDDKLYGGTGNDFIYGGSGEDQLWGGDGNDLLDGGDDYSSVEILHGGTGDDNYIVWREVLIATQYPADEFIELANQGTDTLTFMRGSNVAVGLLYPHVMSANIEIGRAHSTTQYLWVTGNALNNTIHGASAAIGTSTLDQQLQVAILLSGNGFNFLHGGGGDDILYGKQRADGLHGDAGEDKLYGAAGDDTLDGGANDDLIYGEDGNDKIIGSSGADDSYGGTGNDTLSKTGLGTNFYDGGVGLDTINFADASNKVVLTLNGATIVRAYVNGITNDQLKNVENITGGDYADTLAGDSFVNRLDGGLGHDILTGKVGGDRFVFSTTLSSSNIDRITDFKTTEDKFVLSKYIFAKTGPTLTVTEFVTGTKALDANDFIIYNAANGSVWYDADGSGTGAAVKFATLDAVSPGVFPVLAFTHFLIE